MLFYVMSPYSGSRFEMFHRHLVTSHYVSRLAQVGVPVVSPVMHWHFSAHTHKLPTDHKFWYVQNKALAGACDAAILFQQPGWKESLGIAEELRWFTHMEKPVFHLDLADEVINGHTGHCIKDLLDQLRERYSLPITDPDAEA